MFAYPVELTPDDNDTILVTFPDVPGAITFGESESEAREHAVEVLEIILADYVSQRLPLPVPSRTTGPLIAPSLLASTKLALYQAMTALDWRKADLARAMAVNPRQVDRLLDLHHASTIAQLEQALAACGRKATIETMELAA